MTALLASLLVVISIFLIVLFTSKYRLNAFIVLFLVAFFLAITTLPADTIIKTMKDGFGNTMASIGFLIIFGAIIGITLDKTGGTLAIVNYILAKTGEKRSAQALGMTGFITGFPIFCDSGYIILSGLAKSFSAKSGLAMPFMATVLATSLYSVHCLIPPHPGALAAAAIFDVNVGRLIVAGILFAVPGAITAYFWARWMMRTKEYPPADAPAGSQQTVGQALPPVSLSLLPVVVPLLLITVKSLITLFDQNGQSLPAKIFYFPGEPIFALAIGIALALLLLKDKSAAAMNRIFTEAIEKAGPILIITAAGGMFGLVIKNTGVGEAAGRLLSGTNLGLVVPFLIAAVMKTAQGSSTVAIITSASFVVPMLPMLGLDSESGRLLGTLAMGAGSMFVSHANDSYFWVITNFAGIHMDTTLRFFSTATVVMGVVIFACVWIASLLIL
jgi:GntP family gluconate:H+ symporter